MQIELSFLSILDILSIATAFMLGLLFLTIKTKNKKANAYLSLFLWSLTLEVFHSFSQVFIETSYVIPQTSLFTIFLLLLYVNQTMNSKNKSWFYLLIIPGIIFNILFFLKVEIQEFVFFEYIFNISILLFILKILKEHKKNVVNFYSDLEHKTLSWIKGIVFVFLGFYAFWIIEDIVGFQNDEYAEYFAKISTILTFLMIFWIGHNGFSQSEIFKRKLFITPPKETKVDVNISEDSKKEFEKLRLQIKKQKLFTNTDLNLKSLSQSLNTKEKEVSRLINQHAETNFYQFINHFRVQEFKILLQSEKAQQLSILGLAHEAGFSSKSTFYTAFKALEGMTPKQYELSLKKSE